MATYYIDAAAAGTGDGLTPVNAFVSVKSVPWADGDNAWIRRTHKEDLTTNSMVIGPIPSSGWNTRAFSRLVHLTGWPEVTGAFYNERPAAGTSAGWDADDSPLPVKTTFGLNFPTFCGSVADGFAANAGFVLGPNMMLSNVCFVNSGGGTSHRSIPFAPQNFGFNDWGMSTVLNNFVILNTASGNPSGMMSRLSDTIGFIVEKFILVGSAAESRGFIQATGFKAKLLEIHSLSVLNSVFGMFSSAFHVGGLINYSNSVSLLMKTDQSDAQMTQPANYYIQRAAGIEPFSGGRAFENVLYGKLFIIDDYFSKGPRIWGGDEKQNQGLGLLVGAGQYDDQPVMRYQTFSLAAANQSYHGTLTDRPLVTMPVQTEAGTKIEIRVPIYVDSTNVFSPAAGIMTAQLFAEGCIPVIGTNSTIFAGSATPWTGTQPIGGTPYEMVCVFTPTESAVVPFNLYASPWFQTTSGQGITAYALFGKPYIVEAP